MAVIKWNMIWAMVAGVQGRMIWEPLDDNNYIHWFSHAVLWVIYYDYDIRLSSNKVFVMVVLPL